MNGTLPDMSLKMAREVLGVSSIATPIEVRRAFSRAAKRAHPDRGGDEAVFHQVVSAYQRLQDPLERSTALRPERDRSAPDLEISPFVAMSGGEVDHRLADGRTIRLNLPPGLRSGDKVRAAGVKLCIYVRAEQGMLVRGDDLWMTVKIAPASLKRGGRINLQTPLGPRIVWIDAKAAERGLLRLEGQGLPARGRRPRGCLFLRLSAETATADGAAQTLLRRFAAAWAAT